MMRLILDLCRKMRNNEIKMENNVKDNPLPKGSLFNSIILITNTTVLTIDPNDT